MENHSYTNALIHETSPYLLQHAHNPVNWYPWGKEALVKAKKENKLLLISIGYSACHWCHVMEKESFENEEIAKVMNENFVCIKVDREERPDIDQVYMNAVQLITGSGGWPLNCFALPDGRPVYGGTYFKPVQWKDVLENLSKSYKIDPGKFEKVAQNLKKGISSMEMGGEEKLEENFYYEELLDIILKLRKRFDFNEGGQWGAPKFPMPVNYFPLMRYFYHSGENEILKHIELSLNKISQGGIYDHIGGGFARYTVDRKWLVPHFEKMLYDNAQLVSLYAEAFRMNRKKEYLEIIEQSLSFVEKEMMSEEGGFYSSFDADSEGEEGKFYVWDKYEIDAILKEDSKIFCEYYNVSLNGNWEGRNIIHITNTKDEFIEKHNISIEELDDTLKKSKEKLLKQRNIRVKPALDDKIITSWNALMLKAFIDAYNITGKEKYLNIAIRNFDFIKKRMFNTKAGLKRTYKNGKASIDAFLDDYAFLIQASISLYQSTFQETYINFALDTTEYVMKHFSDAETDFFFYAQKDKKEQLIVQTKEITDNVIPASNSVMAKNLFTLGHIFVKEQFIQKTWQMLSSLKQKIQESPFFFANWIDLMIQFIHKPYEVCIVGSNYKKVKDELFQHYLPGIILAGGEKGEIPLLKNRYTTGKTTIYVCQNNVCNKPVKSVQEALQLIKN